MFSGLLQAQKEIMAFDLARSLATLAYEGRRRDLDTRQAEARMEKSRRFVKAERDLRERVAKLHERLNETRREQSLVPDHIERLVTLCEQYDADFAYPRVRMWWEGRPELTCEIGCNPPRNGQFTHCLYTRAALDKGMLFRTHVGSGTDWDAVSRTMAAGARWAFEPATTLSHRVDK